VLIGELDGRVTPRVADYVALLKRFDDAIAASDNVLGLLWGKIGYAGLLIATSLTNDTMAEVLGDRRWQPLLGRIGGEINARGACEAVTPIGVDGFDAEGFVRAMTRRSPQAATPWRITIATRPRRAAASGATLRCASARPKPAPCSGR